MVSSFQFGTITLTVATGEIRANKLPTAASPNYAVPVTAYRVSDDGGSRQCAVTASEVGQWVDEANRIYAAGGVSFVYDGVLHDLPDTEVDNVRGESDPNWAAVSGRLNLLATQTRSVVIVFRAEVGGGFSSTTYDWVAMSYFDINALSLLAHEVGHQFGLLHTFGRVFTTVAEASDYVLSGGHVDDFDGDRPWGIDDTPPDPWITDLQGSLNINAVTLGGQAVTLARSNVMSYWQRSGPAQLSYSQIQRVRQLVMERNARYLNVTIQPPPEYAYIQLPPRAERLYPAASGRPPLGHRPP